MWDLFSPLILAYDKQVSKIRDSILSTSNTTNITFSRYFTITKGEKISSREINKLMRIEDTTYEKKQYAKKKNQYKY